MENLKLGLEIGRLQNIIARKVDIVLSTAFDGQLSTTQCLIIDYIMHSDKKNITVYQKNIEKDFKLTRSAVSLSLNNMEKKGFIVREGVEKDGRLKKIVLTDKAKSLHKEINSLLSDLENKVSKDLTDNEITIFLDIISKIKHNIE